MMYPFAPQQQMGINQMGQPPMMMGGFSQINPALLQHAFAAKRQQGGVQQTLAPPVAPPSIPQSTVKNSDDPAGVMSWADWSEMGTEYGKALSGPLFGTFPGKPGTPDAFAAARGKMYPGMFPGLFSGMFRSGGGLY